MNEYTFIKKYGWIIASINIPILLIFIILLCVISTGSSEDGVATSIFTTPFNDSVNYTITSRFGTRIDPIDTSKITFHSGIDLASTMGTPIVASADGIVYQVGFDDSLGNYVYIKHDIDNLIFYTIYGHMSDNSIVVKAGDSIKAKDKIGIIGSTGRVTGIHLHFMISKNKISFEEKDLIDPIIALRQEKNPSFH